jgi:hypothetical protein
MADSESKREENGVLEYEYTLIIGTDTPTNADALESRTPKAQSTYKLNGVTKPTCKLVNKEWTRAAPCVWLCRLRYSSDRESAGGNEGGGGSGGNQTILKPPTISWGERTIEVYDETDAKGKAYVNVLGDRIVPPPTYKSIGILTINVMQRTFNREMAFKVRNRVNELPFAGCAAYSLLAKQPTAVTRFDETLGNYVDVTYTFEHDVDLWIPTKVLNQGNMCNYPGRSMSGSTSKGIPVKGLPRDKFGKEYEGIVLLDEDGYELAKDAKPVKLEFIQYKTWPFSLLGLGL